jgi:predicted ABC-class ATPase
MDAKGLHTIIFGMHQIDLTALEQLVDVSQLQAIAWMIYRVGELADGRQTLDELIEKVYTQIKTQGLDVISPYYGKHPGYLSLPRKFELAGAINRLRSLVIRSGG